MQPQNISIPNKTVTRHDEITTVGFYPIKYKT